MRLRLAPVSNVNFLEKTDNLSKKAIYKHYLEIEVLGLDASLDETFFEEFRKLPLQQLSRIPECYDFSHSKSPCCPDD